MNQLENLRYEDFRKVLTEQHLKELQIIYFALGFGVFIFTMVLFFIYNTISEFVTSQDYSHILLLSVLHFVLLLVCFPISRYLFENTLQGKWISKITNMTLGQSGSPETKKPIELFWDRLRTAHIIRLALFEGIALFGLVICTLAMFDGTIQQYPVLWINLISPMVFGIILVLYFPTVEKLERFFREYVQGRSY
jgi:hypothetical protein